MALQVYEVGKNWAEADGDVCEAIDFVDYYANEMIRLGKGERVSFWLEAKIPFTNIAHVVCLSLFLRGTFRSPFSQDKLRLQL